MSDATRQADDKIRCDACPVMCYIRRRHAPAPATATPTSTASSSASIRCAARAHHRGAAASSSLPRPRARLGRRARRAGRDASSPPSAPAPPIPTTSRRPSSSRSEVDGVDMVTVVTEGIFSYCGVKVKIDTDRHLGPERAAVRVEGEPIGHVTTGRVRLADAVARRRAPSDRRLQEGGPRHLRRAARRSATAAGRADHRRRRHRRSSRPASRRSSTAQPKSACASAAARPPSACSPSNGTATSTRSWWSTTTSPACSPSTRPARSSACAGHRHQHERPPLDARPLFQGRRARHRLGRHRSHRPARPSSRPFDPKERLAGPAHADGLDHRRAARLFRARRALEAGRDGAAAARSRQSVERIERELRAGALAPCCSWPAPAARCAPASPRTRCASRARCKDALTRVTCGGAPVYVWPGGGITFMVDVTRDARRTPSATCRRRRWSAPIEFTMRRADYAALGGHVDEIRPLDDVRSADGAASARQDAGHPWPLSAAMRAARRPLACSPTAAGCICSTARST